MFRLPRLRPFPSAFWGIEGQCRRRKMRSCLSFRREHEPPAFYHYYGLLRPSLHKLAGKSPHIVLLHERIYWCNM